MAEPPRIDNCTVFLECTSGIGDLLFDTLSGVTVALAARGCTPPVRVRTRWQRRDRHYDWPALIRSELFVMDSPLPVPAHHGGLHRMHLNGGAWPRSFYDEHAVAGRGGGVGHQSPAGQRSPPLTDESIAESLMAAPASATMQALEA